MAKAGSWKESTFTAGRNQRLQIILAAVFSVSYFVTYGYREPVVVLCTITTPRGETNHQIVAVSNFLVATNTNSDKIVLQTIMVVLELWTIFSFVRLLHINRRKQQQGGFYSLTERYRTYTRSIQKLKNLRFQIAENVRMIKIMLPIVWYFFS